MKEMVSMCESLFYTDISTCNDYEVVASMRTELGERGGHGSEVMRLTSATTSSTPRLRKHGCRYRVAEDRLEEDDGRRRHTNIKAALDKVWAITKLMSAGRGGTEGGWIKCVLDRTPAALAMEYYLNRS